MIKSVNGEIHFVIEKWKYIDYKYNEKGEMPFKYNDILGRKMKLGVHWKPLD